MKDRLLGRFKRFAAVGGSEGVLRGSGEWLEEDPRGRFCMLNRSNYTTNEHYWNPMAADMELNSLRGGGSYFWKGVRDIVTVLVSKTASQMTPDSIR